MDHLVPCFQFQEKPREKAKAKVALLSWIGQTEVCLVRLVLNSSWARTVEQNVYWENKADNSVDCTLLIGGFA